MIRPGTPITQVAGGAVVLPGDDVDTDRIIPARFMRCVTFDGLGAYLFHDDRRTADGVQRPEHPLNGPTARDAAVLVVGRNFGCGSSREHAPQALLRAGFRALVGRSFAEIFAGNATMLGIPCATVDDATHAALVAQLGARPGSEVVLDLVEERLALAAWQDDVALDPAAHHVLVSGGWDPLPALRSDPSAIAATRSQLPYLRP